MLGYVQQELIPKLMLKREALSGLFDDNGDNAADVVVGVTADKIVPQKTRYLSNVLPLCP
jgi:hypothetical protein